MITFDSKNGLGLGMFFKKEMYKIVHLMYNVGDKSDHSQISVISAALFPIIDLRYRFCALRLTIKRKCSRIVLFHCFECG